MSGNGKPSAPFREAEVDVNALACNLSQLREANTNRPLLADVGANAWGHGSAVLVPALLKLGVHGFVVARLAEAEEIRALDSETVIISTQHEADEDFTRFAELDVTPVIRSDEELARCLAAQLRRLVLLEDDGAGIPAFSAGELRKARSEAQRRDIEVWSVSDFHSLGAELLGISASDDFGPVQEMRPVLRLWAPVAATKRVEANEGISYGYTYRTATRTTLALVSLGYADGVSRAGGNRVPVLIAGDTVTVAGRMAMDAFMLDLGDTPPPALGTEATVLGDARRGEPTAIELGRILGMSSAEITTRLTARPRRYATRMVL